MCGPQLVHIPFAATPIASGEGLRDDYTLLPFVWKTVDLYGSVLAGGSNPFMGLGCITAWLGAKIQPLLKVLTSNLASGQVLTEGMDVSRIHRVLR